MRYFTILILFTFSIYRNHAKAQQYINKDSINYIDHNNLKQGLWILKNQITLDEITPSTYIGTYIDNKKNGIWKKTDQYGYPKSIETYRNDVLNGSAQYFEKNVLVAKGDYRGLNPKYKWDSIMVVDPISLNDTLIILPSEIGSVKHGWWQYFNAQNGKLMYETLYQLNSIIKEVNHSDKPYPITDSTKKKLESNMPHIVDPKGKNIKARKSLIN